MDLSGKGEKRMIRVFLLLFKNFCLPILIDAHGNWSITLSQTDKEGIETVKKGKGERKQEQSFIGKGMLRQAFACFLLFLIYN